MYKIMFSAIAAVFILTPYSFADDSAALGWTLKDKTLRGIDGSDAGRGADFYNFAHTIQFSEPGGAIVLLSCRTSSNGNSLMTAGLQIDPDNEYEKNPERTINMDRISAKLWLGKKGRQERWFWHGKSTKVTPIDASVSRKIFNSAVRGDKIRFRSAREDVSVQLPAQDKVFKTFAKACPEVNGGKFDMSIFENIEEREKIELGRPG